MWYWPGASEGNRQRPVKVVWQRTSACVGDCRIMRAELTATPFSSATAIVGVGADWAAAVLTRTSVRRRARMRLQGYFTLGCGRRSGGLSRGAEVRSSKANSVVESWKWRVPFGARSDLRVRLQRLGTYGRASYKWEDPADFLFSRNQVE